jgi:hypothetical protein
VTKRELFIGVVAAVASSVLTCSACLAFAIFGDWPTRQAVATPNSIAMPPVTDAPAHIPLPADAPRPTRAPRPTGTLTASTETSVPPSETPVPLGSSRSHPVPFGESVVADNGLEVTVLDVKRGADAWATIHAYGIINPEPDEGMEYVLVRVRAKYLGDPAHTQRVSATHFRAVGELGVIYDPQIFTVLGKRLASELFGGAATEGELAYQVGEGEQGLVLIYDSGPNTKACYCSLAP